MDCGTLTVIPEPGSRPSDQFISPAFNLVLVAVVSLTIFRNASIGCLVDLVASALLIHATFARKQILHENDWASDTCSAKNANEETVYNFFVYSLVSWVASTIIELKSCKFLICKIRLSHYDVRTLNKRQLFFLLLSLIASANACWVMLHFSSTVHKSFERLTGDSWLLMYYLMAAGAKNVRVFLQGLVFTSWVPKCTWRFSPEKRKGMAMGRMGITNLAMLLQAIFLSEFPSNTSSMNSANNITLYIDILYHIILCIWFFLHTDYHQVKAKLLNILAVIYNCMRSTLDIMSHASALTDQNIAHSNEKPQAITVQTSTGTTKVEECHLPQDNDKQEPFAPSTAKNTFEHLALIKVKPQTVSSICSVEEELSSSSVPAVLFPDNFFPSDDNSHWQCHLESGSAHEWTQSEPLQHHHISHDQDLEYSNIFVTPQIESKIPSSVSFEPGIILLDIASLSTDKSQLQTGILCKQSVT